MLNMYKVLLTIIVVWVSAFPIMAMPDNNPVGKIDDEFVVTPMGQVNYEIPIPALPGTGGITPKLSVKYNSSTKSSLFGYGFDLNGLSIISSRRSCSLAMICDVGPITIAVFPALTIP